MNHKNKILLKITITCILTRVPFTLKTNEPTCVPLIDKIPFGAILGLSIIYLTYITCDILPHKLLRGIIAGVTTFTIQYFIYLLYYKYMYDNQNLCADFYHIPYTYTPLLFFILHICYGIFYGLLFSLYDYIAKIN